MFYVQTIKWEPKKVTTIHLGPFKTKEDALKRLHFTRKNKNNDLSIIEKE
jgi:hypothetical protein